MQVIPRKVYRRYSNRSCLLFTGLRCCTAPPAGQGESCKPTSGNLPLSRTRPQPPPNISATKEPKFWVGAFADRGGTPPYLLSILLLSLVSIYSGAGRTHITHHAHTLTPFPACATFREQNLPSGTRRVDRVRHKTGTTALHTPLSHLF